MRPHLLPEADVISLVFSATTRLPADMDLFKRFEEAIAYASVSVSSLEPHRLYPIFRAKRISTKFGLAVVLTLLAHDAVTYQVFLPQR